ncbi:hypothetical protein T02_551 [Trichinella nativa]|nr:hypothetical protein T02_551 [Trichinella nativa]
MLKTKIPITSVSHQQHVCYCIRTCNVIFLDVQDNTMQYLERFITILSVWQVVNYNSALQHHEKLN